MPMSSSSGWVACLLVVAFGSWYHVRVTQHHTVALRKLQEAYDAVSRGGPGSTSVRLGSIDEMACGSFDGCVRRVAAAGDAVQARRGGNGAFATFGTKSCMNSASTGVSPSQGQDA